VVRQQVEQQQVHLLDPRRHGGLHDERVVRVLEGRPALAAAEEDGRRAARPRRSKPSEIARWS
jgi:hypothetical protein